MDKNCIDSTGQEKKYYSYMVECADGSFYCGYTTSLQKRIITHNKGRGAKYTKSRRPVKLVYFEVFETRHDAMSREWHMKKLTRRQKERLITGRKERSQEHEYGSSKRNGISNSD
ncbi:MAG: GIY-YIG nuclease family protein [Erysipelotrichaceae bacterium]|nr:GIY-YIG nuclease family protein [Erysipelotrichaceae bacterium]